MQQSEIINLLKEPAMEIMSKDKIPASIIIAEALLRLDKIPSLADKLIELNNPFGLKAIYKKQKRNAYYDQETQSHYRKFYSMSEGLSKYIISNYTKFSNIKSIYDYNEAIHLYSSDKDTINALKMYIEGFKLYEMDNTVIDDIISSTKNIIDTDTIPENKNTEVYQTQSNYNPDINISESKQLKNISNNKIISSIETDKNIVLRSVNLYKTPKDTIPSRIINGSYYINPIRLPLKPYNRLPIYMKKEFIENEKLCVGYINIKDIQK